MKKVLCFGDSNTFGYNPCGGLRYPKDVRWTGVLQTLLGTDYEVVEAGCNNRTCFRNNPAGVEFTGFQALPKYLEMEPDIVIIGLGSNDLQRQYRTGLEELEYGLEGLVKLAQEKCPVADVILLSPSVIGEQVLGSKIFSFLFDRTSIEKSKLLSEIFIRVAERNACGVIDLAPIAPTSEEDGLHYSPDVHRVIAETLRDYIITNLAR